MNKNAYNELRVVHPKSQPITLGRMYTKKSLEMRKCRGQIPPQFTASFGVSSCAAMISNCFHRWVKHFKKFFIIPLLTLSCVGALVYQNSCSLGILRGIHFCMNTLIPSLFPLMVLASFTTLSGMADVIGKIFSKVTKFLFYLPGAASTAVIMGFIGGYPTSARSVQTLLSKNLINEEQAQRIMKFAVGAGPAFIINAVGSVMLKNKILGMVIFVSQILTSVLTGVALGITARIKSVKFYENNERNEALPKLGTSFTAACKEACETSILMCAPIIFFSALISVLNDMKINEFMSHALLKFGVPPHFSEHLVPILLEVNSACVSSICSCNPAVFMAFAIGWGGLCVHFQIMSVFSRKPPITLKNFALFRFVQGIFSAFLTYLLTLDTDTTISAHAPLQKASAMECFTKTAIPPCESAALILLCSYFLYDITKFANLNSKQDAYKTKINNFHSKESRACLKNKKYPKPGTKEGFEFRKLP